MSSINEIITDQLVEDAYADALTLGPEPGVMDGVDVTIERADVLMQFAVGDTGDVYWQDREYPMRPGTRHVSNVCGVRFRNKQAGAPALINAALTGPAQPHLEPIIPLTATGVGDPIASFTYQRFGAPNRQIGPFDVGDWPQLLLGIFGVTAGVGCRFSAIYPDVAGQAEQPASTLEVFGPMSGLLVVENLATHVTLEAFGSAVNAPFQLYAAPCAFRHQQLWRAVGDRPDTLLHTGNQLINAGQLLSFMIPPYRGIGQSLIQCGAGTTFTYLIDVLDFSGNAVQRIVEESGIAAGSQATIEHPLVSSPMQVSVINTGAANSNFLVDVVLKELG